MKTIGLFSEPNRTKRDWISLGGSTIGSNTVLRRAKAELFGEPQGGRVAWLQLIFGVLVVVGGLASRFGLIDASMWLASVTLGFAILCAGGSELLPSDRRTVAGVVRIISIIAFLLFGILFYAGLS